MAGRVVPDLVIATSQVDCIALINIGDGDRQILCEGRKASE